LASSRQSGRFGDSDRCGDGVDDRDENDDDDDDDDDDEEED